MYTPITETNEWSPSSTENLTAQMWNEEIPETGVAPILKANTLRMGIPSRTLATM